MPRSVVGDHGDLATLQAARACLWSLTSWSSHCRRLLCGSPHFLNMNAHYPPRQVLIGRLRHQDRHQRKASAPQPANTNSPATTLAGSRAEHTTERIKNMRNAISTNIALPPQVGQMSTERRSQKTRCKQRHWLGDGACSQDAAISSTDQLNGPRQVQHLTAMYSSRHRKPFS